MSNVSNSIKGLTKGFADIAGAVYVAQQAFGTAQRVVSTFTDEIKRLDEIGDLAARFNITTDAVQKLQRTFELSGGQAESLNRILGKLQQNLGDAVNGNAGVNNALARINLNGQQLAGMELDKSFETIARQIAKMPVPAERAAVAMDLFGKSATEILEIFTRENVFEDAARDVEDFGAKLDKVATERIGKAAEEMERLDMAWKSLKAELAIAAAPTLGGTANVLSSGIRGIDQLSTADRLAGAVLGLGPTFLMGLEANGLGGGRTAAPGFTAPAPPRIQTPAAISARTAGEAFALLSEFNAVVDAGLAINRIKSGAAAPAGLASGLDAKRQLRALGLDALAPQAFGATAGAGALEFGSVGAFQAIQASKREDDNRRIWLQQLNESKKQTKLLEDIEDSIVTQEVLEPANLQG